MMNKKKLTTSVLALALTAALLLGGTFAWQSISQVAENEKADIVNPGGRLHDDFDGEKGNKDIYVENFGEEPIFARVRLEEYFALVINKGKDYANTETKIGSDGKSGEGDDATYKYTGVVYTFDESNRNEDGTFRAGIERTDGTGEVVKDAENKPVSWWTWTVGGADSDEVYYMPTFNKNKDSLVADVNGWYKDGIGAFGVETSTAVESVVTSRESEQYEKMHKYTDGETKNAWAIYDIDRDSVDQLAKLSAADLTGIINGSGTIADDRVGDVSENVQLVKERHNARAVGSTHGLISMTDWLDMVNNSANYNAQDHGDYWVYDSDGWVYWSAPIQPDTATGLLLDGISLSGVMDDSWYYGINAVAQFVTADDLGKSLDDLTVEGSEDNGTGFFVPGEEASANAEKLLKIITAADLDVYAPDTYAVIYDFGYGNGYSAYYVDALSAEDAEKKVHSTDDDKDRNDLVYCGKASQVPGNSRLAGNIAYVCLGCVSKGFDDTYTISGEEFPVAPTDMSGWFKGFGTDLDDGVYIDSKYLDTSNVTKMISLFQGTNFADGTVDVSSWNTGSVTDLLDCFKESNIETLDLTNWNTGSVVKMAGMFSGCTSLTTLTLGDGWDTSNVTDMNNMFFNCYHLTLDCSGWDVSKVLDGYRTQFGKVGSEYKNEDYAEYVILNPSNSTVNGMIKGITYPDFPGASTTSIT